MRPIFLTLSILAVALAGCSDPPPTGDTASTGHALTVAGALADFQTQAFNDPNPTSDADVECPFDDAPVVPDQQDPFAGQRCAHPYTKFTVNFTALPDPSGQSYALKFYSASAGAAQDIGMVSGHVHPTTLLYMADEYEFDNEAACADAMADAGCEMTATYDTVQVWLGDVLVAGAPLSSGGAFAIDEGLLGASFTAAYEGKDLVLTASGLGPYAYEGWLLTTDDAGVVTHKEKFTVVAGENTFAAPMNVDEYSGIHIHVAGTKLNVAVGAIA